MSPRYCRHLKNANTRQTRNSLLIFGDILFYMFNKTKRIRTLGRRNFEESALTKLASQETLESKYKTRLSMYQDPPLNEISLEQFETWAIDRAKILIEIESYLARSRTIKEISADIKPLLTKYLPLNSFNGKNTQQIYDERTKDHYSHFILRLAFSKSPELRDRFVKSETLLFKIRFQQLSRQEQGEFLNQSGLDFVRVADTERDMYSQELYDSNYQNIMFHLKNNSDKPVNQQMIQSYFNSEHFIKVGFTKVSDLVAGRSVYIRQGQAYLTQTQLVHVVTAEFSQCLERALVKTMQAAGRLDEDDRLLPLLEHLSDKYTGIEYVPEYSTGDAKDINSESVTSEKLMRHYPLEIRYLIRALIRDHHLKYVGRTQLTLFLKGIGLSVDESVKFFAKWFCMNGHMTLESFYKEYKYNIRHCYGLEGLRINYKPWDYTMILRNARPGKGEYHGLIYRDLKPELLTNELKAAGVEQSEIDLVLEDCNKGNFLVAVTRVFDYLHRDKAEKHKGKFDTSFISHPNLWFDRLRQLEEK